MTIQAPLLKLLTKYICFVVYVIVLFLIIGEVYFRLPNTLQMLSYEFDPDFGYRFKPNQSGVTIIGKGMLTPAITLNSEGFRGEEINEKKAILCLGSSEVLGTGVADNETWVSVLEQKLKLQGLEYQTVNAGKPSHGPSHCKITLEKYLSRHPAPMAVIIRVATGDMDFILSTPKEIVSNKERVSRNAEIRKITRFIPYLMSKIEIQKLSILQVFSYSKKKNSNNLNKYETIQAADTMINRFKPAFKSLIFLCQEQNIALVFCIIDLVSAPSNVRLISLLDDLICSTGYDKASICPIMSGDYNLQNLSLFERKKFVIEKLRLPGDPHSNVLQHSLIGYTLSNYWLKYFNN